jgi:hypothetical protein
LILLLPPLKNKTNFKSRRANQELFCRRCRAREPKARKQKELLVPKIGALIFLLPFMSVNYLVFFVDFCAAFGTFFFFFMPAPSVHHPICIDLQGLILAEASETAAVLCVGALNS